MRTLTISLPHHRYPIYIGESLDSPLIAQHIQGTQVMVVSNTTVAPLYYSSIEKNLSQFDLDLLVLPDGEAFKNQENLFKIYDQLIKANHHRDTTLIALGGGVVGDITGFAASTYQRGVNFIQIPTTLLAQVDASIGGKTAINHPEAKNSIGSFYQPQAVLIDVNTLNTLPARELRAGLAEVIKYGLLAGNPFLENIKELLSTYKNINELPFTDIIGSCCEIKAKFVQKDERDHHERALLNLGHTFAHALETYTHYERWLHGEAVAIGLYCAALLSYQLGHLHKKYVELIDELLQLAQLPRRIPSDISLSQIFNVFFKDKKVKENKLRFVLMKGPSLCYLDSTISEESLRRVLHDAVEGD